MLSDDASDKAEEVDGWVPFYDASEFSTTITEQCNIDKYHPVFELHTIPFKWPDSLTVVDNSNVVTKLNSRVPKETTTRRQNNMFSMSGGLIQPTSKTKAALVMVVCMLLAIFIFGVILGMKSYRWKQKFLSVTNSDYQPIDEPAMIL